MVKISIPYETMLLGMYIAHCNGIYIHNGEALDCCLAPVVYLQTVMHTMLIVLKVRAECTIHKHTNIHNDEMMYIEYTTP